MNSPSSLEKEGLEIYIARDGLKLYVRQYLPTAQIIAVVLMAPGIGGIRAHDWDELGDYLSQAGYLVFAIHDRGTGHSDGVRGDICDYQLVIDDFKNFLENTRTSHHDLPIFVLGHSLGGSTAIQIARELDTELGGVVIINPAYRYLKKSGPSLLTYLNYGFNVLFRPTALTVDMMSTKAEASIPCEDLAELLGRKNDPTVVRKFSMRYMLSVRKVMKNAVANAKLSKQPLLMIIGAIDPYIDHRGSEEIFAAWGCVSKKKIIIQDGGHGVHVANKSKSAILEWLNDTTRERSRSRLPEVSSNLIHFTE